jgi:hypothetical protein
MVRQLDLSQYSLSERFQLVENVRSCTVIRRGIIVGGIISIVLVVMMVPTTVFKANLTAIATGQLVFCFIPV